MVHVLVADSDQAAASALAQRLCLEGYETLLATTGSGALRLVQQMSIDIVICDLLLTDTSGLEVLRTLRRSGKNQPFVMICGSATMKMVVETMKSGAFDFLEKSLDLESLASTIAAALHSMSLESHATARWARLLVAVIDSPTDPRTIADWASRLHVSPGALRNWCRTAKASPRRSLLLARLLRAVVLSERGQRRPENLLDVADLRTLRRLLQLAGAHETGVLPATVEQFLTDQIIIGDHDAVTEVRRAMADYQPHKHQLA